MELKNFLSKLGDEIEKKRKEIQEIEARTHALTGKNDNIEYTVIDIYWFTREALVYFEDENKNWEEWIEF